MNIAINPQMLFIYSILEKGLYMYCHFQFTINFPISNGVVSSRKMIRYFNIYVLLLLNRMLDIANDISEFEIVSYTPIH